jgi:hypothetical protein
MRLWVRSDRHAESAHNGKASELSIRATKPPRSLALQPPLVRGCAAPVRWGSQIKRGRRAQIIMIRTDKKAVIARLDRAIQ